MQDELPIRPALLIPPTITSTASLDDAFSLGYCPAQEASNPGLVDISFKKVRLKENTNWQLIAEFSPKIYLTHTELFSIMLISS